MPRVPAALGRVAGAHLSPQCQQFANMDIKCFCNALISRLESLAANGRQLILANSGFSSSGT